MSEELLLFLPTLLLGIAVIVSRIELMRVYRQLARTRHALDESTDALRNLREAMEKMT